MNCRSVQNWISPYLDQQLTGAQMLAMQQHLHNCPACAEECRQVQEVRGLLRSLAAVAPDKTLDTQIARRVAAGPASGKLSLAGEGRLGWETPRPQQRGRRLAGALALACTTLLMMAAPFAPSSGDAARMGAMQADLAQGAAFLPAPPVLTRLDVMASWQPQMGGAAAGEGTAGWDDQSRASQNALSQSGASVTLTGWSTEPLDDEAVGGYAVGDAAAASGH